MICLCQHRTEDHDPDGTCRALVFGRPCACRIYREVAQNEVEFDKQCEEIMVLQAWPPHNEWKN